MISDEEIFAMKKGKELDDLVAEKVMDGKSGEYSRDISSAWKVVKKIEEKDWRVDIMSSKDNENVGAVKIVNGRPVSLSYLAGNVESKSVAEAICKAALLIVNNSQQLAEMK